MYKNKLYKQIDGVTMGCPLGPTLANFFLSCIEQKLFENKSDFLPSVYLRYIDDIYCVFDTESNSLEFLQMLNLQHATIKFTIEKEANSKSLTFLDLQNQLTDKGYDTCVWRKSTNTGLQLNYKANCSKTWKSGLIVCFLHRAKNICSKCELYLQELDKLRGIFQMNGYPNLFINDTIKKFEEFKFEEQKKRKNVKKILYLQLVYHILKKFLINFPNGLKC